MNGKLISMVMVFTVVMAFGVCAAASDVVMKAYQEEGKPRVMNFVSSQKEMQTALGAYNMLNALSRNPAETIKSEALKRACAGGSSEMSTACDGLGTLQGAYSVISGFKSMDSINLACTLPSVAGGAGGELKGVGDVCSQYQSIKGEAQKYAGIAEDPTGAAKQVATQQLNMMKQKMYSLLAEQFLTDNAKNVLQYARKTKGYLDAAAKDPSSGVKENLKQPKSVGASSNKAYNIPRNLADAESCNIGVNMDSDAVDESSAVKIGDVQNCMIDTKGKATKKGEYGSPTAYLGQGFIVPDRAAPFKYNFTSVDGTVVIKRLNGMTYLTVAGPDTMIRTYGIGWIENSNSEEDRDNEIHHVLGNSYLVLNGSTLYGADITVGEPFFFVEYDEEGVRKKNARTASVSTEAIIRLNGRIYSVPYGSRVVFNGSGVHIDMRYTVDKAFGIMEEDARGNLKSVGKVYQLPGRDVRVKKDPLGGYRISGDAEFRSAKGNKLEVHGTMIYRSDEDFSVLGLGESGGGLVMFTDSKGEGFMVMGQKGWTWVTQCNSVRPGTGANHVDYCRGKDGLRVRGGASDGAVSINPVKRLDAKEGDNIREVVLKWKKLCEFNKKRGNADFVSFDCNEIQPDVSGKHVIVPGLTYSAMPGKKFEAVLTDDEKRLSGDAELTMPLSTGKISVKNGKLYGSRAFSELLMDGRKLKAVDPEVSLTPSKLQPSTSNDSSVFDVPSPNMCSASSLFTGTGQVVAITGMQSSAPSGCVGKATTGPCGAIRVKKDWRFGIDYKDVSVNGVSYYGEGYYFDQYRAYGVDVTINNQKVKVLIREDDGLVGYEKKDPKWAISEFQGCGSYVAPAKEVMDRLYDITADRKKYLRTPPNPPSVARTPTLAEQGSLGKGTCSCDSDEKAYAQCLSGKNIPNCVRVVRATGGWLCNSGPCVGSRVRIVQCADDTNLVCTRIG